MTVNRTDTARLGSASPPRNRRSNNVGRQTVGVLIGSALTPEPEFLSNLKTIPVVAQR
jgi:hypothetical protein